MTIVNINEKVLIKNLVNALQDAGSGKIVYQALQEAPSENLLDMSNMIHHILGYRHGFEESNHVCEDHNHE